MEETLRKLDGYDQQVKNKAYFMKDAKLKGSRGGIIPGDQEAEEELIRTQLLIGKLKADGKYQGQKGNVLASNNGLKLKKVNL